MRATESGARALVNNKGQDVLVGYATVQATGWIVVAQRPVAAALAPLDSLMKSVILKTLPLAMLILVVVWWGARKIAEPLQQLAANARSMDVPDTETHIKQV